MERILVASVAREVVLVLDKKSQGAVLKTHIDEVLDQLRVQVKVCAVMANAALYLRSRPDIPAWEALDTLSQLHCKGANLLYVFETDPMWKQVLYKEPLHHYWLRMSHGTGSGPGPNPGPGTPMVAPSKASAIADAEPVD